MGSGASKETLSTLNVVIIGAGYAGTQVHQKLKCYTLCYIKKSSHKKNKRTNFMNKNNSFLETKFNVQIQYKQI